MADGLTKSLQGQAFDRFLMQLHMKRLRAVEVSGQNPEPRQEVGGVDATVGALRKMALPGVLAATSAVLISAGQCKLGSLVSLCALVIWKGQKNKQEQSRRHQEASKEGGSSPVRVQDGKPSHGGATSNQKTRVQVAGLGVVQEGKPESGGASVSKKTEERHVGPPSPFSWSPSSPALWAFRVRIDVSHEPAPEPSPGDHPPDLRGRGSMTSSRLTAAAPRSGPGGGEVPAGDPGSWRTEASSRGAAGARYQAHGAEEALPVDRGGGGSTSVGSRAAERLLAFETPAANNGGDEWEEVSSTDGVGPDPFEGPWNRLEFARPGTGKDHWIFRCQREGWLVRAHPQFRQRRFLPAMSNVPGGLGNLEGTRLTKKITQDGAVHLAIDDIDQYHQEAEKWTGFTFLKIKNDEALHPDADHVGNPRRLGPGVTEERLEG